MSQSCKRICDECCKELTSYVFETKGWMTFQPGATVSISTGEAYSSLILDNLDFCSIGCFYKWISAHIDK